MCGVAGYRQRSKMPKPSISATAAPQNMEKLEKAIQEELSKALKDGFTAEELAKAKSGILQKRQQSGRRK